MAKATEHPSATFGTAARAFRLLENLGINILAFLQRIIDDPKFRRELAELINPTKQYDLPEFYHPEGIVLLNAGLREYNKQVGYTDRMRFDSGNIAASFAKLEPRLAYIFALRYGLFDGKQMSYTDIGKEIGVSGGRVSQLLVNRGFRELRKAYFAALVTTIEGDVMDAPIESLNTSERAWNCMRRVGINTIGDLVRKTEDDLLAITNFGMKCLDETVDALEKLELRLAG